MSSIEKLNDFHSSILGIYVSVVRKDAFTAINLDQGVEKCVVDLTWQVRSSVTGRAR